MTKVWGILLASLLISSVSLAQGAPEEVLKSRQSTINGLVIIKLDNGKMAGQAIGVVATVNGNSANGAVSIRGEIGEQMKTALQEAERVVRVNHPTLAGANIELSFEDKYSPKDGGSAGAAFTVLLESLFDGYKIDPKAAVTGDIAVNRNVQPIGGVAAKCKGAMADGCGIVVLPKGNVPAVNDLLVTAKKDEVLKSLQIFSASTVDDVIAVVRADRKGKIQQAVGLYSELQGQIEKNGMGVLQKTSSKETLAKILELTPNHVSAKYALDIANGKGPTKLTRTGSVVEIFIAANPLWETTAGGKQKLSRASLPKEVANQMLKDLSKLKMITHSEVEPLRRSMYDWCDAVNRVLSAGRGDITMNDVNVIEQRQGSLTKELKRLDTDDKLIEKMMREGY